MACSFRNVLFSCQKTVTLFESQYVIKFNSFFGGRCIQRHFASAHSECDRIMTMKDVRKALDKCMDFQEGYAKTLPDRSHLLKYLVKSQDELPPRTLKDSFSTAIIPLSTVAKLHHRYSTVNGKLRMGRIMEDMDFFAVYICLKHIKNPNWVEGMTSPYTIVTAAVDDIEFTSEKPEVNEDIKISGQVVNTGKSSMDVCIKLERKKEGNWIKMTVAYFSMVARNSTMTGSAIVNRLIPDGPEEEKIFKHAVERRERKQAADKMSLLTNPPSPQEQNLIHELFMNSVDLKDVCLNTRILPEGTVWMEDSILTASHFPHPENRNHHNTVFGGYLMRLALELAWMTAYKYSTQKPSLRYISNVTFKHSVSLSSFLKVMGQVIFTQENYMQLAIFVQILDIVTKEVKTANSLYFTYEVRKPVMPVMPKTYHESILWLQGVREFEKANV